MEDEVPVNAGVDVFEEIKNLNTIFVSM